MASYYERTRNASQTLEAWVAAREAAIERALKCSHALLEDLAENSTLYRSRVDRERLRLTATYLNLGLERARRGLVQHAIVFCCRACEELWYKAPLKPRLWRLFHPTLLHSDFVAHLRFRHWGQLEGADAHAIGQLLKDTRVAASLVDDVSIQNLAFEIIQIGEAIFSRDPELCALRFTKATIELANFVGLLDWIDSPKFHQYWLEWEVEGNYWEVERPMQGYRRALASFGDRK